MSFRRQFSSYAKLRLGVSLAVIAVMLFVPGSVLAASQQPIITILGVTVQSYVQIRIDNLPPSTDFTVTMSDASQNGYGPTIAHFNSGKGGEVYFKFPIVASVRTHAMLALRIASNTGYAAYTTFDNTQTYPLPLKNQGVVVPIPTPNPSLTATPAPIVLLAPTQPVAQTAAGAINILHVQKSGYVMVMINNMPLNTTFNVMMGSKGTQGLGGYPVANLPTGVLSSHIALFTIPAPLKYNDYIDLRIQATGYLYVKTFANTTY